MKEEREEKKGQERGRVTRRDGEERRGFRYCSKQIDSDRLGSNPPLPPEH